MRVLVCAVLCGILLSFYCSVSEGQMVVDCCLEVKNKAVDKRIVVNYSVQVAGQGCAIDAMVLMTRPGRTICVPPGKQWVKDIVKHVDNLKKHCHRNGYKGRRCEGVRRQ